MVSTLSSHTASLELPTLSTRRSRPQEPVFSTLAEGVTTMLRKLSRQAQSPHSVSHSETLFCPLHKSVSAHSACGHQRVPQSPAPRVRGTPPLTGLCRTRGFTLTRESGQERSHSRPEPVTLSVMRLPRLFSKLTLRHLAAACFP